ncbi:right-handed parallel beta-helix repeat-containing protein [Teredinibacter franksiae]|uniref:right-handed parallel beta-helix repeat-containing protein n=1 Tax=Teredinibacter franksiae TaxID=2761453 RepID=UPI001627F377|nr:right-handed parallel beta-helix repeat-containing protein [Teredinibacter franksiae]
MKKFSNKINCSLLVLSSVCVLSCFALNAHAYDTSTISGHPTSTVSLQSGQTYDFGGRNIYGDKVGSNPLFKCHGKENVTLKNVNIKDTPQFGIWVKNCKKLTISNVTLRDTNYGGIRFEKGSSNSNITLSNINGKNLNGHGIELWDVDGFNISNIEMHNTKYCGLLLNRSKNGSVGKVYGTDNDENGGYATLRFANSAGPNISVSEVISRSSGRGYFVVSGSQGITVNSVNISGANKEGIYIQEGSNNKVKSGNVQKSGSVNCRVRNSSGSSISANCNGSTGT